LLLLAPSLVVGGHVAAGYGAAMTVRARGSFGESGPTLGRPFELRSAILLGTLVSAIMVGSAVLLNVLGPTGALLAAALGGFADAHSAAIAMSSLVTAGKLTPSAAIVPILLGMTANSLTKLVVAISRSSPAFGIQVGTGTLLIIASLWAAALLTLPPAG
jgi:uncharacterized membrane protein (DUF4010 family)